MARKPMGYWNQPARDLAITHDPTDANNAAGYIVISRGNQLHYLHRWLWKELIGPIPYGYQIDHDNGIRTDCRLNNLRCIEQVYNLRNSAIRSDNVSGVTGVSWWDAGHAWRAVVWHHITKKQICRTFSSNKYGCDNAFHLACEARKDMINQLNAQGAGYTERHGKC